MTTNSRPEHVVNRLDDDTFVKTIPEFLEKEQSVEIVLTESPTKTRDRTATVEKQEPPEWVPEPLNFEYADSSYTLTGQTDYWLVEHKTRRGEYVGIDETVVKLAWRSHPEGAPIGRLAVVPDE
ncbi:hypothetical protein U3A55_00805 [Salarchaeum sp. III]|uniref:hypothetical protein n=1 Tax=Salarchaeum sp. III TaxID=3107927 RepID=UPI002ED7AB2C